MPTSTYTPLANLTLGSSAASVTFSSIAAGLYRDLVLIATATGTANTDMRLRLNSDTGTNYNYVYMYGTGSSAISSSANLSFTRVTIDMLSSAATTVIANFMDYAATDKHKTVLTRSGTASASVDALAHRWADTSAISTIYLYPGSGSFASGSTFALYGINS